MKLSFQEFVDSLDKTQKEKIWAKATNLRGNGSRANVDIWLEVLKDLYSEWLRDYTPDVKPSELTEEEIKTLEEIVREEE